MADKKGGGRVVGSTGKSKEAISWDEVRFKRISPSRSYLGC